MTDGLEDVIAAQTRLSDVDGTNGRLVIRGVSLDALAGHASQEMAASLLLDGADLTPGVPDEPELRLALGKARVEAFALLKDAGPLSLALPPTDALRALLAVLPDGEDLGTATRLIAAPAVFLPAVLRQQAGLAPIPPDAGLRQAEDILRMLTGKMPSPAQADALDSYLVTICDHGLNASTFVSRVVASTGAGLTSSALAALGALKGPLHGGAPGPVLDMLDAIGTAERARDWLLAALDRGERLMGFGHRVYKVRDPRADALKRALQPLMAQGLVDPERMALADMIEQTAVPLLKERKPGRSLDVNVEFYTALLLEALGFPRQAFTGVFAIGRMTGWIAHAREQARYGRLIRPRSIYIGPLPEAA